MALKKVAAVVQITSCKNKDENFYYCKKLVEEAAAKGAQMVFLPEACDFIAETKDETHRFSESLSGPLISKYCQLAEACSVWLSLGGIHVKEPLSSKISNTHIIIDEHGNIVCTYSKCHLFDVNIPERNIRLEESSYIQSGSKICSPVLTPVGYVGLGICYDMRFPEMSVILRKLGAEILTFPSAFTVATGQAHWEILLRARAIENQCYVIAAAQVGQHNKKRSSHGQSMIIDPWGKILCRIGSGVGFSCAEIDLSKLYSIRQEMPVFDHRRRDLYHASTVCDISSLRLTDLLPNPSANVNYQFGSVTVPGSCVFLKSALSQAFINKKPVVPGHVLLCPERHLSSYVDLTPAEVCDMAQLLQYTEKILQIAHNSSVFTVAVQDGAEAGQTINHVHIHILPLSEENHKSLQEAEHQATWISLIEMEELAAKYRKVSEKTLRSRHHILPGPLTLEDLCSDTIENNFFNLPNEWCVLRSIHSLAYAPAEPILKGHIIVVPKNPSSAISNMSVAEITDLLLSAQLLQSHVMEENQSFTFCLVNNQKAESSNKCLCLHMIPRTKNDLVNNDDIYKMIHSFIPKLYSPTVDNFLFINSVRHSIYNQNFH